MIQMKKMQYVLASLLAASVFTTAAEAANFNNEVKTQQGVVAGAYDDKHQVVQWLGVPYAQQPTGADRWREAQQAKSIREFWTAPRLHRRISNTTAKRCSGRRAC